ncbi:MAG: ATP-dependent helicase [Patescibacteria group bacterium]
MSKEKILLNESQKKAVEYSNGALLVVAGAGTGKTRVIAQRVKSLIHDKKVNPQGILALTFTEKASQEMLERVDDVMPLGYEEPWIYTFHSFADRLLRSEGLEIGLDPSYKILSGPEQWLLLRKHLFKFDLDYFRPLGNPTKFISAILSFISRLQDENISAKEFSDFAEKFVGEDTEIQRWQELASIYLGYEKLKLEQSRLDFGDLIMWAIKLFNQRPNLLIKYQNLFKHTMVDEFQDTNHAQYELIKLLCPSDKLQDRSLLVVGDDSQSIYKFRGAAISNILEFQADYPKAEMVTLLDNYRSSQKILDPAYTLIQNNNPDTLETKLGISKELVSKIDNTACPAPQIIQLDTIEDEVEFVLNKILELLGKEANYTYKDFAILARANGHLEPFVMALRKYGLPYQLVGNRGLYDRDEVRDIIALLKVLLNPSDTISLYRVLNIETLNISTEVISDFLASSRVQKIPLWELIKASSETSVQSLLDTLKTYQDRITKMTPTDTVYQLTNAIGYLKQFTQEDTVENQLCIRNLDLFLNIVKKFEVSYRQDTKEIPTIIDFVDYLDLIIEAGDNPAQAEIQDIDTINLLTVHASKGLEFPVVFIVNLVGDRFPTRNRKDMIEIPEAVIKESLPTGNAHIQEERRLFYVGITRARKHLYMTLAKNYGGKRDKVPSGFLQETGLNMIEAEFIDKSNTANQIGIFGLESGYREPKAEKITNFSPKFLSYSQIATYETCPLQYKYSYVLNIPSAPNHALSFGITLHDTLRDFHASLMFDQPVSLEDVYQMYERNWQPLGYLDSEHREMRYNSGKSLLADYYNKNINTKIKPVGLEKSFNIWMGGIKFYGKIDRIDPLPDGGVEIIDYKTGSLKDQKHVDKDSQVAFYALGAKEALGLNPKKLTYYYVEAGEKLSTERTDVQLEKQKLKVVETVEKIKEGDFNPKPGMHCNWCDYKDICPHAYKG